MHRNRFSHVAAVELVVVGSVISLVLGVVVFRQLEGPDTTGGTIYRGSTVPDMSATAGPTPQVIVASNVAVGEAMPLQSAIFGGITLFRTDMPPPISVEIAMKVVNDSGVPWGLGQSYDEKTPVVSAAFGLATAGSRAPDGQWIGDRNIPLPDGRMLDHIENRPMWIIDYGNTVGYGSGGAYNHTVYAVDAITQAVFLTWFYNVDSEPPADDDNHDGP